MGASHSRARPGTGPAKITKFQFGKSQIQPATGYFIISLKGDRIKVVNAESPELKLLTAIIRRHCKIVKEGWDRHLTYMYKLKKVGRHMMIQLVADFLLSLYQVGWEPMTPIDMGIQKVATGSGPQTAICFRRKYGYDEQHQQVFGSNTSILSQLGSSKDGDNNCLCLETYKDCYVGFHDVTNTVLYELVETIRNEWTPGLKGVSMAVSSVISDYTTSMPPVLPGIPECQGAKYLQLEGAPWSMATNDLDDSLSAENLQLSIIACLSREGYKLSMSINMDTFSHVYFFIKERDEGRGEVRVPNMAGAGLGEKDTLSVYRPMVVRSKSSFFRSYTSRSGTVRRKVRPSLRKKAVIKSTTVKQQQLQNEENDSSSSEDVSSTNGSSSRGQAAASHKPAMSYKPLSKEPAWWQQTSTDVSSDHEDFL